MPGSPQQEFSKFFDGESVREQDIVVWFNLGMHHFTRAEDVPVTLFTEAVSSVVFAPQNFFGEGPLGDLRNRVWVEVRDGEVRGDDYGVEGDVCVVELREPVYGIERILVE